MSYRKYFFNSLVSLKVVSVKFKIFGCKAKAFESNVIPTTPGISGNKKTLPAWLWIKLCRLMAEIMHIYDVLYFVHLEMTMKQIS
jgi:hypothetical protein